MYMYIYICIYIYIMYIYIYIYYVYIISPYYLQYITHDLLGFTSCFLLHACPTSEALDVGLAAGLAEELRWNLTW